MDASPKPYQSSPSYYSAVRGGGGITPTPTPGGSSSSSSAAAMNAAASLVPPPPLGGDIIDSSSSSQQQQQQPEDDPNNNNTTVANNNTNTLNSTPYLQSRLVQLRSHSHELSSELTKKLATSRSGQSLLHIGPSLSTLPPDLSSLLDALQPLLEDVQKYESENRTELEGLVKRGRAVQRSVRKRRFAVECAEIYRELVIAEEILGREAGRRVKDELHGLGGSKNKKSEKKKKVDDGDDLEGLSDDEDEFDEDDEELDHASSLERAAYTTLHLLRELQSSSAEVSAITRGGGTASNPAADEEESSNMLPSLTNDSNNGRGGMIDGAIMEKSRFLMKLAPRIRRLESDTVKSLVGRLESLLIKVRHLAEDKNSEQRDNNHPNNQTQSQTQSQRQQQSNELLLMIGHTLRGLALLSKGSEAESSFARVAIMPIVRSKLSVGRLDEGGGRGECAGLFFLLDDIANCVGEVYGEVLRFGEGMFASEDYGDDDSDEDEEDGVMSSSAVRRRRPMEVDLVTCGVWVPVATALMADPGIKMAIFSPGIANVLQANYSALDTFLSELASNLLSPHSTSNDDAINNKEEEEKTAVHDNEATADLGDFSHLYYQPNISHRAIEHAQSRLYAHPTTLDYYKRWNLPIYYQLRFAEFTKRLDVALERVVKEGWHADVFTGEAKDAVNFREGLGFELPVFVELYDGLLSMWKSTVFLRPLTHRFLRGGVQLVGRMLAFVKSGLDGEIEFGGSGSTGGDGGGKERRRSSSAEEDDSPTVASETIVTIPSYHWNERVEDIAVVSWELTILSTCLSHDYLESIANTVCPPDNASRQSTHNSPTELDEIKLLASEILMEASCNIPPLVERSWNELIVDKLTSQCSGPLAAVKGVAATYRMTNRPPPTQASPFVATILRPLEEFDGAYASRTPPQIGDGWKRHVIESVSDKYASAVEELIATVKRTEEALKSRKTRRMMAGGMSDGEKVKLQLFLDHREYRSKVEALLGGGGEDENDAALTAEIVDGIGGLVKLGELTEEAESLFLRTQKN